MKKIFIYITILLLAVIIGVILLTQTFSQIVNRSNVTFTLGSRDFSVIIYEVPKKSPNKPVEVKRISSSETVTLSSGDYYYITDGENVASSAVNFSVPNDTAIVINPDLTNIYLATLLPQETPKINQLIETQYPKILNGYKINTGKFYKQGQWYATIISNQRSTNDSPYDEYRVVLHKKDGQWVLVTTPEISLSAITFPDVPREILSDINNATIDSLADWGSQSSLD